MRRHCLIWEQMHRSHSLCQAQTQQVVLGEHRHSSHNNSHSSHKWQRLPRVQIHGSAAAVMPETQVNSAWSVEQKNRKLQMDGFVHVVQ